MVLLNFAFNNVITYFGIFICNVVSPLVKSSFIISYKFIDWMSRYVRVSTTPGNLLEFENPPGNPGNLLEFKWSSWKFLCNDRKLMMWHCLCIEECNIKMLLML